MREEEEQKLVPGGSQLPEGEEQWQEVQKDSQKMSKDMWLMHSTGYRKQLQPGQPGRNDPNHANKASAHRIKRTHHHTFSDCLLRPPPLCADETTV